MVLATRSGRELQGVDPEHERERTAAGLEIDRRQPFARREAGQDGAAAVERADHDQRRGADTHAGVTKPSALERWMNGRVYTLYSAMHSVAPTMIRSPRQAPARRVGQPRGERRVDAAHRQQDARGSCGRSAPRCASAAPTTMVISGRVESASVPRATVV